MKEVEITDEELLAEIEKYSNKHLSELTSEIFKTVKLCRQENVTWENIVKIVEKFHKIQYKRTTLRDKYSNMLESEVTM